MKTDDREDVAKRKYTGTRLDRTMTAYLRQLVAGAVAKDISIKKLAKSAKVPPTNLVQANNGDRRPTLEQIDRVAAAREKTVMKMLSEMLEIASQLEAKTLKVSLNYPPYDEDEEKHLRELGQAVNERVKARGRRPIHKDKPRRESPTQDLSPPTSPHKQ